MDSVEPELEVLDVAELLELELRVVLAEGVVELVALPIARRAAGDRERDDLLARVECLEDIDRRLDLPLPPDFPRLLVVERTTSRRSGR